MSSSSETVDDFEISIFPIPGSVSLPFSVVPLHVFEPRYRKMIKDSVAMRRRIGVAHTQRVISPARQHPSATLEQVLNQNQDTYEAYEIVETLPDGRMMVEIKMDSRYEKRIGAEVFGSTHPFPQGHPGEQHFTVKQGCKTSVFAKH